MRIWSGRSSRAARRRAAAAGRFLLPIGAKSRCVHVTSQERSTPQETRVVYANVFPDGRVLPNKSILYHGHPAGIFPQLPRDAAEATKGWESVRDDDKTTFTPLKSAQEFVFEAVSHSLFDKIYLSSSKSK